jgi:Tol biopolymer transport system component/tRNA A-37 threonylcarbamoyl transferase component Bud32
VLTAGTRLNRYRILRALGAGGMGEVYEAEDTRLKRRIAIKLLPETIASDPVRLARFEYEAQAVAALNHPNIVTIHSVEEDGEHRFLTMELVDGRTLDQLVRPGGLPLPDLLEHTIPLVDAIAAAHARGIVHRDLKPSNVMLSADNRIKVLDFGLAKPVAATDAMPAETRTVLPMATAIGQIVGTASYMSPEQAEGRPVDQRSDMFSIGIILYELASGVRPFRGDSSLSILSSIVRDDPPRLSTLRPDLPPALDALVAECLDKDPSRRPAAEALRDRMRTLAAGLTAPASRLPRAMGVGAVIAAVGLAGLLAALFFARARREAAPGTPTFTRVTFGTEMALSPSLSPDGRTVLYVTQAVNGRRHLFASPVGGSGESTDLTGAASTAADDAPAFSPDGGSIAFASSREGSDGIFVMRTSGGGARRIVNGGYDPSWTPDGRVIVYSTESGRDPDGREAPSELWAVELATGTRRRIAATDAVDPRVSPDGRFAAFWALPVDASGTQFAGANRDVWLQPLAGGARVRITDIEATDWNPAWSADGRFLYFSSDRSGTMNIWRVAIDTRTGAPDADAVAVTAPSSYVGSMSVGADGTLAYASMDYDTSIRAIDLDPVTGTPTDAAQDVVTGHRSWLQPDVSPDGRLLTLRSFRAQEDVWVVGVDGSGLRPVTNDPARDRGSRFAPDGSLLFYSPRNGTYQFWTVRPDGSGLRQLTRGDWTLNYPLPSPNGRWVAGTNPNTNEQYIFDAHDWTRAPERLPSPPVKGQMYLRDWSPDNNRFVAADTSNGLWVFDLQAKAWTRIASGSYPRWLPDGRRVLAALRGRIVLVDTVTKATTDVYGEPGRFIGSLAIAPGGRRVYFTSAVTRSQIWTASFR